MGFIAGLFAPLLTSLVQLIPGLATIIGNTIVKNHETEAAKQGNENQNSKELALGWLASVNATNEAKGKYQTEKQVMTGLLFFAVPVGVVFWGAMLDGMPFHVPLFMSYPHIIGSWGVTVPPEFKDDVHMIIQSFFIAAPAVGAASILAKAFRRDKL
jgi:hypothetical protein